MAVCSQLMSGVTIVEVDSVTKQYPGGVTALDGVSFWLRAPRAPAPASARPPDAFLMQIGCASCSPLRVMRVLHPADPPSWRSQGTSHDLPKLGVADSNLCPPLRKKPRFREVAEPGLLLAGASAGDDAMG